jgi:hypothetical protein
MRIWACRPSLNGAVSQFPVYRREGSREADYAPGPHEVPRVTWGRSEPETLRLLNQES